MNFTKEQFARAIELWGEWNTKINVVSRKDVDCLFEHHILHSLAIAEYLDRFGLYSPSSSSTGQDQVCSIERHSLTLVPDGHRNSEEGGAGFGTSVLDVGCGGGFPGIPLAMVMPDAGFTLCDSIGKKIRVAQAVADGLGLSNVRCVNARAETLPEKHDWVVSRAVTGLENFYPWVKGKYRRGILYLKGGDVNEEISAMCAKCRVDPSKVTVWPIKEWLDDDYFAEKFVIHIRN